MLCYVSLGSQTVLAKKLGLMWSCQQIHSLQRVTSRIFHAGSPNSLQGFQQDFKSLAQLHPNQHGADIPQSKAAQW